MKQSKIMKINRKLGVLLLVVCVSMLIMSSLGFAANWNDAKSSAAESSSSGGNGVTSTSGLVELYSGQFIAKSKVEDVLSTDAFCVGTNQNCWTFNDDYDEVLYYGDTEDKKVRFDSDELPNDLLEKDVGFEEGYLVDTGGGRYTSDGTILIGDQGQVFVTDGEGGYEQVSSSNTIEDVAQIKSYKLVDEDTVLFKIDGGEDSEDYYALSGNKDTLILTQEQYDEYGSLLSGDIVVSSTQFSYGENDGDNGFVYFEETELSLSANHEYQRDGKSGYETKSIYDDGTVLTKNEDGITLTLSDGTKMTGDSLSSDGVIKDGGEKVAKVSADTTKGTIRVEEYSNDYQSNPRTVSISTVEDGEVVGTHKETYSGGDGSEYRIDSDQGTYKDIEYITVYSEDESFNRVYTTKDSIEPIGLENVDPSTDSVYLGLNGEMGTPSGDFLITAVYVDEETGKETYGEVRLESLVDGEVELNEFIGSTLSEDQITDWKNSDSYPDTQPSYCSPYCMNYVELQQEYQAYQSGQAFSSAVESFFNAANIIGDFQGLSSLLYPVVPFDEWAAEFDSWWSRSVLNEEAIASAICYNQIVNFDDVVSDGVTVIENSYGSVQTIAHIYAEASYSDALLCTRNSDEVQQETGEDYSCPQGLYCADDGFCYDEDTEKRAEGWFYKITWGVQAPEDQAQTPYVDENGVAVKYNIWVEGANGQSIPIYEYQGDDNCPLQLVNGASDGQVITTWSNNNYVGHRVWIGWEECGTKLKSTGGATGVGFGAAKDVPDAYNYIREVQKGTVQLQSSYSNTGGSYGSSGSVETEVTTSDVTTNTDW